MSAMPPASKKITPITVIDVIFLPPVQIERTVDALICIVIG